MSGDATSTTAPSSSKHSHKHGSQSGGAQ
jgi:hypothetical protein